MGKNDRAVKDLSEAIRHKRDSYYSYHERGAAYQSQGKYEPALQDYGTVVQLKPDA